MFFRFLERLHFDKKIKSPELNFDFLLRNSGRINCIRIS